MCVRERDSRGEGRRGGDRDSRGGGEKKREVYREREREKGGGK